MHVVVYMCPFVLFPPSLPSQVQPVTSLLYILEIDHALVYSLTAALVFII